MTKRTWALLAATMVSLIYGLSFTIAKDVMPTYVKPFGFILLRVSGAALLFWLLSFFGPKEKIQAKDFSRIIAASFFGVALNMLTLFQGIEFYFSYFGCRDYGYYPHYRFDFIGNYHERAH